MKLFWIHKNVPLGIGNTYIWGFFHFIHPQGLIDKISSIKFVFGLMSKQNQLQPNQMWFPHWNTYKRFMLVAFWQISKFCQQSPFWCPNLSQFQQEIVKFWFSTTLNSFWTTKSTFHQPTTGKWSKLSKMRKKLILKCNTGRKNTFLMKCVLNVPKCIQVGARPFFDKFSQKYGYLKGC